MKISVIIPTYKGADVICRAVNSVLEQEYSEEFEVSQLMTILQIVEIDFRQNWL